MNDENVGKLLALLGRIVQQNEEGLTQGRAMLAQYGEVIRQNGEFVAFIQSRDEKVAEHNAVNLEISKNNLDTSRMEHAKLMFQMEAMKELGFDLKAAMAHNIKVELGKMERDKKYAYPEALQENGKLP
jgi:hypothetical protein